MKSNWTLVKTATLVAILATALPVVGLAEIMAPQSILRARPAVQVPELPMLPPLMPQALPSVVDLPDGAGINDGSFENGPGPASGWTEDASDPTVLPRIIDALNRTGNPPQDGIYCWEGGGRPPINNLAYQTITIPDSANCIKFYYSFFGHGGDDASTDYLAFGINGTLVYTKPLFQAYSNWPAYTMDYIDVADYQGQDIELTVIGSSLGTTEVYVFVDNLTTDDTLVQQPVHNDYVGGPSQDCETANDQFDTYFADDFALVELRQITSLWVPGSTSGAGDLSAARSINVAIYADAAGVPAGYPNDGVTTPVWSLTVAPTDAQVDITADLAGTQGDIKLTLDAPPTLDAGVYWIITWMDMDSSTQWMWGGSLADRGHEAVFINPGDGWALGATTWASVTALNPDIAGMAIAIEHEAAGSAGGGSSGGGGGGCFISSTAEDALHSPLGCGLLAVLLPLAWVFTGWNRQL